MKEIHEIAANALVIVASFHAAAALIHHFVLSMTVVFPEPPVPILRKYQLASDKGQARAIVMPSVSDRLIDQFLDDYLGWWKSSCKVSS